MTGKSVDDILTSELFGAAGSEMAETLQIVEKHLVALSGKQVAGLAYLKVLSSDGQIEKEKLREIINSVLEFRGLTGSTKGLVEALDKISLIDYFKGVKLNMGGGGGAK